MRINAVDVGAVLVLGRGAVLSVESGGALTLGAGAVVASDGSDTALVVVRDAMLVKFRLYPR